MFSADFVSVYNSSIILKSYITSLQVLPTLFYPYTVQFCNPFFFFYIGLRPWLWYWSANLDGGGIICTRYAL